MSIGYFQWTKIGCFRWTRSGSFRRTLTSLTDTVTISQNEAGIDTEDRIIKLKKYIANMK